MIIRVGRSISRISVTTGLQGVSRLIAPTSQLPKGVCRRTIAASSGHKMTNSTTEVVTVNGKQYGIVREGLASVLAPYHEANSNAPPKGHNNDEGSQAVFYNPIQQFNRDLSVLAILIYGEGAIVEKEARFAEKRRRGKDAKKKQKARASNTSTTEGDARNGIQEPSTSRKRKADEIEEDPNREHAKKARREEFEADEDEMEVMQLNGNSHESQNGEQGPKDAQKDPGAESVEVQAKKVRFTILDALSATGLRALRYAKELPFTTHIVANDVSKEAVKSIELNIDHNDVRSIVHSNVADARAYMYSKAGNERSSSDSYIHRFDVVDLDPYGTAAPFLDAAVQALADGGLLCVTCTDAGVFASNGYPEKAYALYGGIPCKGPWSHEAGLRLILNAIATTASKYGIAIEPLLSLSIDFYARVFVRLHKSPQDVKMLAGTTMMVYNCDAGCGAWSTQLMARNQAKQDKKGGTFYKHSFSQAPSVNPHCDHCGTRMHLGGPMWAGPLHNPYFIQRMLDRVASLDTKLYATTDRLRGMLTLALEEDLTLASSNTHANSSVLRADAQSTDSNVIPRVPPTTVDSSPFFFIPGFLSKVVHCATPAEDQLRGAIRSLGYLVTRSHCKAGSFKTNAPWYEVWEVMREWVRQLAPIKQGAVSETSPGWMILQQTQGTAGRLTHDIVSDTRSQLQNIKGAEDLKMLLRSAMYRLEHERPASGDERDVEQVQERSSAGNSSIQPRCLRVRFDVKLGQEKPRGKLVRYQINPRANWGPMTRATGSG